MPGKSLDDIWRQMQAQRAAEQQQRMAQERALYEQRERLRQEYLQRMRMYEFASANFSPSSAAAGAGGGGNRQTTTTSVSDESILYWNFEEGKFSYFIYNFETESLTEIKEISLSNSPSIIPVTRGGFFLQSYNGGNSNYDLLFISLNGEVIWQDTTSDEPNVDIENFSRYVAAYYLKDGIWKLEVFNEDGEQRSFEFGNPIEGGGYSYDDVWNGGFVVREDIDNIQKYHIINFSAGTSTLFNEVDTDTDYLNVYQYAYSDKILTIKNGNFFEVYSSSGQKIAEFNVLEEFEVLSYSYNEFTFLNENGSFILIGFIEDTRNIIFFSGESNQFSYKRVDTGDYQSYRYDVYNQKNYISSSSWIAEGSAIFMFYNDNNQVNNIDYYGQSIILPVWSTDSQLRDFWTFSSEKGIVELDDSDIAISRSENYINLLIDNNKGLLYLFSDDGDNNISDGGDDMYDTGNYLYADNVQIEWTHTQLSDDPDGGVPFEDFISDGQVYSGLSSSVFGASSSADYFTNLYPGLFVLAAQNVEIDEFKIDGGLGADGDGQVDNYSFEVTTNGTNYGVYVKRVWDAQDPSVNHIIIVKGSTYSGITQSVDLTSEDDLHKLEGLAAAGINEIYYLLLALKDGFKLEDDKVEEIVNQFLSILTSSSDINELLTNLNSDWSNITGVIPEPDENYSILRFNREGEPVTLTYTDIPKSSIIGDEDQIGGKTILQFEREFQVTGTWGWTDLSDLEDRFFYSFREANNNQIGNYVVGQELVMKDVVNNQYWGIKFTEWEQGGGGGFAYTRQLIEGGTFSGEITTFTHSSWESEPDVIIPGVLEIKRAENGPIYNSAKEDDSNGENPTGTLWNSQFVYNLEPSYNFKWWYTDGSNPTSSVAFNSLFTLSPEDSGVTYGSNIDWTSDSGKPGYLPSENFAWQVECLLKVEVAGDYLFMTNSDDGNQLTIDGDIITEFYGSRGMQTGGETSSTIPLSVGLYTFRYRMQQGTGGSGASVKWKVPGEETFSTIPSSNLVINETISEYGHYILNTQGQIVDSVTTSDDYSNEYEGSTFIIEDEIFNKTWVSNKENNGAFQLLPNYYRSIEDNNNTSEESGLRLGNFIISNGFRSRIITEDSVSSEFIVPKTGSVEIKIDDRDIFHNGAWVVTIDESDVIFYFYNTSGVLVGQKSLSGVSFNGYQDQSRGKRCSMVYEVEGLKNVILFNGTTIKEVNTQFGDLDISINDYYWWND